MSRHPHRSIDNGRGFSRELIQRFAPPPPVTVVDVCGAAGAYAPWMAEAGYSVHPVYPVPRLVAEAPAQHRG